MGHQSLRSALTAPFFGGPIYVLFAILAVLPFVPLVFLSMAEVFIGGIFKKHPLFFLGLGWKLADKLEPIEKAILQRAIPKYLDIEDIKAARLIPGSFLMCVVVPPVIVIGFLCAGASVFGEWMCGKWEDLEEWVYA